MVLLVTLKRRLHCSANWFVLSLALADFAVGAAIFPMGYVCRMKDCNMTVFVAFYWLFLHASVTNLCALTWDRYITIVHPFHYPRSTTFRRPGRIILLAWSIPIAISLSLVLGMYATKSRTAWKVLRLSGVSAFNIISCLLLFYAVVRILIVQAKHHYAMKSLKRQVQHNKALNQTSIPRRRKKGNAVGFIIAIVMLCLACYIVVNYLVFCITFSCESLPKSDRSGLALVCTLLLMANSAVNPLVYAFLKQDIKREFKQLICRQVNQNSESERSAVHLLNVM